GKWFRALPELAVFDALLALPAMPFHWRRPGDLSCAGCSACRSGRVGRCRARNPPAGLCPLAGPAALVYTIRAAAGPGDYVRRWPAEVPRQASQLITARPASRMALRVGTALGSRWFAAAFDHSPHGRRTDSPLPSEARSWQLSGSQEPPNGPRMHIQHFCRLVGAQKLFFHVHILT